VLDALRHEDGLPDGADPAPLSGTHFRYTDHLGSGVLTTRADGAVIERVAYEPFGAFVTGAGDTTAPPPFGFTGQRFERGTGLYDYGARWYDPHLGRFLQPDALVADALDPQQLNPYSYVENDPLDRVDPSGNFSFSLRFYAGQVDSGGHFTGVSGRLSSDGLQLSAGITVSVGGQPFAGLSLVSGPAGLGQVDVLSGFLGSSAAVVVGYGSYGLGFSTLPPDMPPGAYGRPLAVGTGAGFGVVAAVLAGGVVAGVAAQDLLLLATRYPAMAALLQRAGANILDYYKTGGTGGAAAGLTATGERLLPFTARNFRANLGRLTGEIPEGVHAHHVFPRQFSAQFERLGIEINDPRFGAWWQAGAHQREAAAYNRAWRQFLSANPTTEQALQFGREISRQYGITVGF